MSFLTDFFFLWRTRTSSWMLWNMLPTCLGSCALLCYLQRAIMSSVSFQEEADSWNVFPMGCSSAGFGTMVSHVRYLLALFSSLFSDVYILFRSTACLGIFVFGTASFFLGVNEQITMKISYGHSNLKSLTMRKRHGNFWWATLLGSLPDRWICQRQESGRPLWACTVCWKYHSKTVSVCMFVCFFFFKLVNSCPALGSASDWLLNQFTMVSSISAYLECITVELLRLECRCRRSVLPVSVLILHMTKMKTL